MIRVPPIKKKRLSVLNFGNPEGVPIGTDSSHKQAQWRRIKGIRLREP